MCPEPPFPKYPQDPWDDAMFFIDNLGDLFDMHRPCGRSETSFLSGRGFHPSADVFETPDGLTITIEVPGMARDQIDITIEGNRLTVSGGRDFERESPDEETIRLERGFGSFRRTFEIFAGVDPESVTAKLDLGVLTIMVPGRRQRQVAEVETFGTFE